MVKAQRQKIYVRQRNGFIEIPGERFSQNPFGTCKRVYNKSTRLWKNSEFVQEGLVRSRSVDDARTARRKLKKAIQRGHNERGGEGCPR